MPRSSGVEPNPPNVQQYELTEATQARTMPRLRTMNKTKPKKEKLMKPLFENADQITRFRRENGMVQNEFWARVGVTQSGGSRYESGRNIPRPVQILLRLTYGTEQESAKTREDLRNWRK